MSSHHLRSRPSYLAVALIAVVFVLAMVWDPSPTMSSWIGGFAMGAGAAGLTLLALTDRPSRNSETPIEPVWQSVVSYVGLILVGVENVWPQYHVSKAGFVLMAVGFVPNAIRLLRQPEGGRSNRSGI